MRDDAPRRAGGAIPRCQRGDRRLRPCSSPARSVRPRLCSSPCPAGLLEGLKVFSWGYYYLSGGYSVHYYTAEWGLFGVYDINGMAIKGTGALLLLFIAYTCYHVALGALRTIGFWVGSGILGAAAFFAWRMLKGSKKE